jgi:AAA domain
MSRRAKDIKPRPVTWLYADRIPLGMLTVVAGPANVGKGLFASHLSAEVSKAGGVVLYSAIEDDEEQMIRPRLEAVGANLNKVWLHRLHFPDDLEPLAEYVAAKGVKLVILDPWSAHLGRGVSRFSDAIRDVTTPLSKIAETYGCSIVIMEHTIKRVSRTAFPLSAIGGSGSGLTAACRMGFIFGTDPDNEERKVLACVKHNIRPKADAMIFDVNVETLPIVGDIAWLDYDGEEVFDPMRLLVLPKDDSGSRGKPGRAPEKRARASEWLTLYLYQAGGPVRASNVMQDAKDADISAKTLRNASQECKIEKHPPGGGRNCTWDIPAATRKAIDDELKNNG